MTGPSQAFRAARAVQDTASIFYERMKHDGKGEFAEAASRPDRENGDGRKRPHARTDLFRRNAISAEPKESASLIDPPMEPTRMS